MPEPLLPIAIAASQQGGRGQAVDHARPARRRRSDAPLIQRHRDRPAGAVVHGRGARRRRARPARHRSTASRSTSTSCGSRCAKPSPGTTKGHGPQRQAERRPRAVRDLPHRGRAAALRQRASSSSTRSSVASCRASSSRASRRACAPSSSGACGPATRWSTCGSRSSTARRTRSTRPTWPSRSPAGSRCAMPPSSGAVTLLEPVLEVTILVDESRRGGGHVGPVHQARPGHGHRARRRRAVRRAAGQTLIRAEVPETELGALRRGAPVAQPRHGQLHAQLPASRAVAGIARRLAHRRPSRRSRRQPTSAQACTSSSRVSASRLGSTRVCPTTGMKFVSPPQRGTTCWCRWAAMPAPAIEPEVDADVEALRAARQPQRADGALGEDPELHRLLGSEVGVVGRVAERHDHEVARVVRVQVQHRVDVLAARDDQRPRRRCAAGSGRTDRAPPRPACSRP